MSDMRMFAQITKVDEAKRLVFTRVVDETPDRADERFDYAKSKPYFEAWSKNQFDASGGKSYGNVRAMHGKVAAGVIAEPLSFSDAAGTIDATFKIVDDQEWTKVLAGVYTGASIGGSYVGEKVTEKIGDRTVKRYVADPVEVSLVDSPCIPTARFFDVVKADGTVAKLAFKPPEFEVEGSDEQVAQFAKAMQEHKLSMEDVLKMITDRHEAALIEKFTAEMLATSDGIEAQDAAKREFSADERKAAAKEGTALPDGSFPIKSTADLKNAISAYGRAKDKAAAKAHIIKRAKALGAVDSLPPAWKDGGKKAVSGQVYKDATPELRKGMWNVADFASCLSCCASVCRGAQDDFDVEGDGSPIPAQLRNWLGDGIELFKALADEESSEMLVALKTSAGIGPDDEIEMALEMAAKIGMLRKRLADPELTFDEYAKIVGAHLTPEEIKAAGRDTDKITAAVLAKAGKMSAAHADKMQAIHDHAASMGASCSTGKAADVGDLSKVDVPALVKQVAELTDTVAKFKKQPVPFVTLRAVPREEPKEPEKAAVDNVATAVQSLLVSK